MVAPTSEWLFPSPKGPVKGGEEDGQDLPRQRAEESGGEGGYRSGGGVSGFGVVAPEYSLAGTGSTHNESRLAACPLSGLQRQQFARFQERVN